MKQSERLNYYIRYNNNQNKKQYETEKINIISHTRYPFSAVLVILGLIPYPMVIVYVKIFFSNEPLFNTKGIIGAIFEIVLIVGLGSLNLVFCALSPVFVIDTIEKKIKIKTSDQLASLKEKYNIVYDLEECDSFRNSCGELDLFGRPICSVTHKRLSNSEYYGFCNKCGSCHGCKRMLDAAFQEDTEGYFDYKKR